MPRTDKVGSDTLAGPRFVAKQDSYKVQYPGFAAKQHIGNKRRCTRGHQRPAACTSSPLTEEEAVQSANLRFQCNKLQWHTLLPTYLSKACARKIGKSLPSLCLLTLTLTADCVSPLLVFCLSQFEILNQPYASEEEALGLSCSHAVPEAELSHAA